jgi:isopenicillin N synthase-like dioxygenase
MDNRIDQLGDALRAKRVPLDHIPVVDLGPLLSGTSTDRMAQDIRNALSNIGFFYVTNHGVTDGLIDRAFAASKAFFDLPLDEKMALHISKSGEALHGYTEIFGENTDPTRTRDLKEIFDLGRPAKDGQTRPFFGPTPWPAALPVFERVMMQYHNEMLALARRILSGIALSLTLPRDYFEPMMQEPIGIQRVLHYPPQNAVKDDRMIGIGAHTDYGCLTILAQDDVGGLQIMNRDGDWIDAPAIPDTFVINIGDMMQRLTNDVYLANLHRVINTSGRERYSIPFFFDVDYQTIFAPLDVCISPENPAKYDPVMCGAHKWARYAASYPHLNEKEMIPFTPS